MSIKANPLMTPTEVSNYLQVPARTLAQWRAVNKQAGPKFFKVGRHVRYRWLDVLDWLETQEGRR